MSVRQRVNGRVATCVPADDRGLCYGDGLFETVWVNIGHAPLWPRHMARLTHGCAQLGMPLPDADFLWREVSLASAGLACAIVRITWTRGSGPRGYAPPVDAEPLLLVSAAAHTPWPRIGTMTAFACTCVACAWPCSPRWPG